MAVVMSNFVRFGFCLVFGLTVAELDWDAVFEGTDLEICMKNFATEYTKIVEECRKEYKDEFIEIPNFLPNIQETDSLMPPVILTPKAWECVYQKSLDHDFIQDYVMYCLSQLAVESIALETRAQRVCECTVRDFALICKEKKVKKKFSDKKKQS